MVVTLFWCLVMPITSPARAVCAAALERADAFRVGKSCVSHVAVSVGGRQTFMDDKPKPDTAEPVQREQKSTGSRFGLAARVSTLSLGADAGFRLARPLNLRVGFNSFDYSRNLSSDGVAYRGTLHLRSVQASLDWFPFSHSLHFGPGLLILNGNRVTALATPPVGRVLRAGAEDYISDPQDPIKGSAKSGIKKVAPMVSFGFGNLVPRKGHFAYSVDFGVVFQGAPRSTFTLLGGACDPTGEFCARVADVASIQSEIQAARADLDRHVSFMKYYPVMSVEFGYRF